MAALEIDTVVLVGLWTDERVSSTAYAGNSRGYDVVVVVVVVVVADAVDTATANQKTALTVADSTVANVLSTGAVLDYMASNVTLIGGPGAVVDASTMVASTPNGREDVTT